MRFLSTFRAAATKLPSLRNSPGPPPAWLPPSADGGNPLQRWLDGSGLPWRAPRRQVEATIGVSTDRLYARPTVFFPDAVRPPGLLQPWQADVFERYAPDLPIVRFSGVAWCAADAYRNIEQLAAYFAGQLGPAPIGQSYNTLTCGWASGLARFNLTAWPPAWQSPGLRNDAHARDPRLATACHVTLQTGFRLPLTAEEQRWVEAFCPVAEVAPFMTLPRAEPPVVAPADVEVEYARDPGEHWPQVRARVGRSVGGEALILGTHQLFVVPSRDIMGFCVTRLLPAKGGGGSALQVRCRTTCPGVDYKTLYVGQHDNTDGMNELGRTLADLFGTSCDVGPYYPDV